MCCVDEKDALPADHVTPNRRPVGRISGKTGLLADGAFAPGKRFAQQNLGGGRIHFARALKI